MAALLRSLGCNVRVLERWDGETCDALVALHAQKSSDSVLRFHASHPDRPVVVVLAGTDIYPVWAGTPEATAALDAATLLVGLQAEAANAVPARFRPKVRTIVQSATPVRATRVQDGVQVVTLAHLRPVKDPLRGLEALELLPPSLPLHLVLAGTGLDAGLASRARAGAAREPRFRWLGELDRKASRNLLATSHACLVPSRGEGGANVVSEAIASGVPVIASEIPGNTGILGRDWPALFPVGDTAALARLLHRLVSDDSFRQALEGRTAALAPLVDPASERARWRDLLCDLRLLPSGNRTV
ncbi:MAG: hypothetical protein RL148_2612 [Planctomycetota bacterium]